MNARGQSRALFLLIKSRFEIVELFGKLFGQLVAELGVVLADALALLQPQLLVNAENILNGINGDINALEVYILGAGLVAERGLNCVLLAEAAAEYPLYNAQVVAEAGPLEVALVVGAAQNGRGCRNAVNLP